MDTPLPFDTDLDRLRLLYRLPIERADARVAVVGEHAGPIAAAWPGSVFVPDARQLCELPQGGFDAVALAGALPLRDARLVQRWFEDASLMLGPGGVLVGHAAHGLSLRRLALRCAIGQRTDAGSGFSAPRLLRLLRSCGLTDARCHYVMPDIGSPFGLVPSEPAAARAYFRRLLRTAPPQGAFPGRILRIALARVGCSHLLRDDLFYWARRPC